jgi:hypothetical protein
MNIVGYIATGALVGFAAMGVGIFVGWWIWGEK